MAAASPASGSRPSRGAPRAPLGPVAAVTLEGVGGPGGGHVGLLVVAEGHLVDQVERPRGGQRAAVHGPERSPYRPELLTIPAILSTINNGVLDVESLVIACGRGRVLFTVHDLKARRL